MSKLKLCCIAIAVASLSFIVTTKALGAGLAPTGNTFTAAFGPDVPVVSSAAEAQALGGRVPDIMEEVPAHLSVQNSQHGETLRFSTTHWNFGDGPLDILGGDQVAPCDIDGVHYDQCTYATQQIRNGAGQVVAKHPAGVAFFHPQHNHWHQSAVATFAVRRTPTGAPVAPIGFKTTFCLVDTNASKQIGANSTRFYWDCNAALQGISVGWGDEYHQSTQGQELDISGLADGVYYLTHDADPDGHWIETNDGNNASWVKFSLTTKGSNSEVKVLDEFGYEGNTSNS